MNDRDFTALSQAIGDAFFAAAPKGWVPRDLRFTQVGKTGEFGEYSALADGSVVRFIMPNSVERMHSAIFSNLTGA